MGSFVAQLHRAPAVVQVRGWPMIARTAASTTGWCSAASAPAPARSRQLSWASSAVRRCFVAVVVHRDGGVPLQVETLVVNPRSPGLPGPGTSASSSRPPTCRSWRRCPRHAPWSKPPCPARTTPVGWPCRAARCLVVRRIHYSRGVAAGHPALGAPGARLQLHGVFGAGA